MLSAPNDTTDDSRSLACDNALVIYCHIFPRNFQQDLLNKPLDYLEGSVQKGPVLNFLECYCGEKRAIGIPGSVAVILSIIKTPADKLTAGS